MSRERISEMIVKLQEMAADSIVIELGCTFTNKDALKTMLPVCETLRYRLQEDGRYGYIIEQVGRVQGALRHAVKRDADPFIGHRELRDALGRLRDAWQQTARWASDPTP